MNIINIQFNSFSNNVKLILITTLLSNIGIFMVIPFLAIYLTQIQTLATPQIGFIIGIAFWCQRAGSFLGGLMADYLHVKATVLFGLIIRIPEYFLVGYVNSFYILLISCSLIGLGSSIYLPAAKSYLVKIVGNENKIDILSTRMIFSNIGVAIGPIIGMSVFTLSPLVLFILVGIIFSALALLNLRLTTHNKKLETNNIRIKDFMTLLTDRLMISIAMITFLSMAFYIQIEVTIPMFSSAKFNNKIASYVFICNALIVIFFQSLISKWACRASSKKIILLTFMLFSLSFLLMNFATNIYAIIFIAVIIFSFAQIIIQIRLDYDATHVNKNIVATSFGIMSLAGAFGGLSGSYVGTLLYCSETFGLNLWEILSLCCAGSALFCFLNPKNKPAVFIK